MFHEFDASDIVDKMPMFTQILLWVFGRRLNSGLFSPVILRAHERGLINSNQMHSLLAQFDPTQHKGVVGMIAKPVTR